jgi:hypothetical protein
VVDAADFMLFKDGGLASHSRRSIWIPKPVAPETPARRLKGGMDVLGAGFGFVHGAAL